MSLHHQENNSISEVVVDKTISGLKKLLGRTFFVYFLKALSVYFISKWLTPADYGTFAILNNWVWAFALFLPDLALEAALIQQKNSVLKEQEETLFFISFWRAFLILAIFVIFSSRIVSSYEMPNGNSQMLILLSLSIFFSSMVIPHRMHFERELKFSQIIKSDVIESITLYSVQITLAYLGYGIWSLIISNAARSLVSLIMMNCMLKRLIIPKFHKSALKGILSFGMTTQVKKIVLAVKTMIIPLLLGRILPIEQVGLITWSLGIALIPSVLAENYDRVLFPALSRLQDQPDHYGKLAQNGINVSNYIFALIFGGIAAVAAPVIRLLFSENWLNAISLLPLAALSIYLSKYRYLYCSILNSKGRPKQLLMTESFSTTFEIIFCYLGLRFFSLPGFFYGVIISELCLIGITKVMAKDVINSKVVIRFCVCTLALCISFWLAGYISDNYFQHKSALVQFFVTGITYLMSLHIIILMLDRHFIKDVRFAWKFKNSQSKTTAFVP